MSLIITTPNTQIEEDLSYLKSLQLNGDKSRKIFTIQNLSLTQASFNLTLTQGGTGSAFKLYPGSVGGTASIQLNPNNKVSIIIDYDSLEGSGVTASLFSDTNIYGEFSVGSTAILGPTASVDFTIYNPSQTTSRSIGPILSQSSDGEYIIQQAASKITQDETSFGLIRTNPKLTGNVKITVDSNNNIWLNSIDAEKELADDRFKKFSISPDSSYTIDVKRFFDLGQTPSEIVFSLYQLDQSPILPYGSTRRTLSEQYDRFYQYGATQLVDKLYPEDFSFLAPLYLKTEIPQYFVIFRTDGPINKFTYEQPFEEWSNHITAEILKNSQIIKVYDLGETSQIGRYLRKIVNHPARVESDITVSYQQTGYTTFNGISYSNGTFVQAGELLFDYINEENPLINVEEFITLGFQRNNVISSHLLNLEFLFNDPLAQNYSINRYFGFYVNSIDLAKFGLSPEALSQFSLELGQTPLPRKGVDGTKVSEKSFVQKNANGIKIFADAESIQSVPRISKLSFSSIVSEVQYTIGNPSFTVALPGDFLGKVEEGETVRFFNTSLEATAEVTEVTYNGTDTFLTLTSSTFSSTIQLSNFPVLSWNVDFYTETKLKTFERSVMNNLYIENVPRFFYIKDKTGFLNSVASTTTKYAQIDPFTQKEVLQISLKTTETDISNFSGAQELLTQTTARLLPKGRSSISIEVNDYFSPNDYLEVRWEPGPTATGFPLRWRVVANSSSVPPGSAWPSYTLTSDSEGEYFLGSFNPGNSTIDIQTFVKSIQSAFDQFPYTNFEVLAKGNFLHFRSTQEGRLSESAKLIYSSLSPNTINVMGVPGGTSGNVNFIGGSDRNRTRARISKEVAEGMITEEYISTKGNYEKVRSYKILNNTILFAPYLEEPVYDESGEKLIDFVGSDIYRVVSMLEEKSEIQLTSDNKFTTYDIFEPTFGILSILPVKDFDTDFYSSDYNRNYNPELIKYFGRELSPTTVTNISTSGFLYTFSDSFEFPQYPYYVPFLKLFPDGSQDPILFNKDAQFVFHTPGATADLEYSSSAVITTFPGVDDQVLFLPGEKALYFTEDSLSTFKGFLTLSGIVSSQDEQLFNSLENLWDPSRFNPELGSEYDRLSENYLKTLVLKSRVVPYILKWVAPQGKDIRDNPYRLNYHRSFGNMGFSPSENLVAPNPTFLTHEWPYLDSVPLDFPVIEYPESTFSYFFDKLTDVYDFSSLKRDWFSYYFSTGYPTEKVEGEIVNLDPTEKYSYFNFENFTGKTFVFFRGYRFQITDIDPNTNLPISESRKYNNYRFSAVIKCEETDPQINQNPVEFKMIVNEKWKFIVLIITIRTSSYRFPKGNLRYVDLYTLTNSNDYGKYDHQIGFTLPGYYQTVPTDHKLTYPINLESNSTDPTLTIVADYYDAYPGNDNYVDNLRDQILTLPTGNLSDLVAFFKQFTFQTVINLPPVEEVVDLNTIKLSSPIGYIKLSAAPLTYTVSLPYSSIAWEDYIFYHQLGGNSSLVEIAERVSFAEINKMIAGTSERGKMLYEIYKEDGSVSTSPSFSISPISPEQLERAFDYFPISDPDKPSEFYEIENIGAVLEETKDLQMLYRYQGGFSPKFRDVLKFWLREEDDFTLAANRDFLFNNTRLATVLERFSLLENQFYNKVSDSEILSLSPTSGYSPVYPLINEVAIDRRDLFAWSSSWDQNYYRKYISTSAYEDLKGTDEMKEIKSFFGSKLMKVPTQFDLYQFTVEQLEDVSGFANTTVEFSYVETPTSIILQINAYDRLLREMLGTSTDLRAKEEFLRTVGLVPQSFDTNSIEEKVREYLVKNIMSLYRIREVKFYTLVTGNSAENKIETLGEIQGIPNRPIVELFNDYSLSEAELQRRRYLLRKDTKLNQLDNLKFQITFPLDTRFYTSLSVGMTITRI
jgi:hypothetical protein